MPVNFQTVREEVIKLGQQAPARQARLEGLRRQAQELLARYSQELEMLRQKVDLAGSYNHQLRCAVPWQESLAAAVPLGNALPPHTVLAGDGSQIPPDPHAATEFALVNSGAFLFYPGCQTVPHEETRSKLLFGSDLFTQNGMLTEDMVDLKRDIAERQLVADLAEAAPRPVVALTDGPIELYRQPLESEEFKKAFNDYLAILRRLAAAGVGVAGYVDRPRADLVVRLLELTLLPPECMREAGKERPLAGVSDADLFHDLLREPGARSAVFGLRSISGERFSEEIALHFFYLNVSLTDQPYLARVEIPAWVAQNAGLLEMVRSTLVEQCKILATRPYPYVLQRAHEIAVVRLEEKEQLNDMIQAELLRQGLPLGDVSHKQNGKNLKPRTRYTL
jgi:hypothetical protein